MFKGIEAYVWDSKSIQSGFLNGIFLNRKTIEGVNLADLENNHLLFKNPLSFKFHKVQRVIIK